MEFVPNVATVSFRSPYEALTIRTNDVEVPDRDKFMVSAVTWVSGADVHVGVRALWPGDEEGFFRAEGMTGFLSASKVYIYDPFTRAGAPSELHYEAAADVVDSILVNWGDGSAFDNYVYPLPEMPWTHEYTTPGDYDVELRVVLKQSAALSALNELSLFSTISAQA